VHQAPPVGIVASNAGAWRWIHIGLPALAAGVVVAWLLGLGEVDAIGAGAAAAVAAFAAGLLARRLAQPQPLELRWDGRVWLAGGEPVGVELMIDLGSWLLLRLSGGRRRRWLAVPQHEAGSAWHGLRAALYAPPGAPATPTDV
jgi:hypothetical protein